jgi:hypothetical protein
LGSSYKLLFLFHRLYMALMPSVLFVQLLGFLAGNRKLFLAQARLLQNDFATRVADEMHHDDAHSGC